MNEQIKALILAGGFATRLWPLTEKRAKPLLPLAGKPLIAHIIEKIPASIPIIISTNRVFHKDFLELKDLYKNRDISVFIEDSLEDKAKKGALGASSLVIEEFQINTPLLLIAGDNYFGFDMGDFLSKYDGKTLLASYDTKSLQTARQFGVLEVEGTRLLSFVEKPQDPPSTLISTGCYLFSPRHLQFIKDYARISADNLGGIFEYLLKMGEEVEVYSFSENWIDIGSFDSYLTAHRLLTKNNLIADSAKIINSTLGKSVEIDINCVLENCSVEESIIMEGARLKNARIRGCIIDKDCLIEDVDLDHKMIRAGAKIQGT